MDALEAYLKHERLAHIRIDGGVNKKHRDQLVCRFQEDSTVSIHDATICLCHAVCSLLIHTTVMYV